MKLSDILAVLPSLHPDERAAIARAIKALAQLQGQASPVAPATVSVGALDNDAEMLLEAICDFMRDKGLELSSVPMVKRTDACRSFANRSGFVSWWLSPSKLSRVEKRLFLAQTAALLYDHLTATWPYPVGMKQMLLNAYKLPVVVDVQLPGYAKQGLLRLTIKREVQDVR